MNQSIPVILRCVLNFPYHVETISVLMLCSPVHRSIPPSECMIPGKTYFGKLPGHSRKVFVRKRPSAESACIFPCRSSDSLRSQTNMGMFSRARENGYYVSYGPRSYRSKYVCTREEPDIFYTTAPEGRVATVVRQTCASCGKFRSAKWEAAHPLLPGMPASSGICARCQRDKTSSDERPSKCHYCKRKHHHHHRHSKHCTDSSDDKYYSVRDRRSPRRYTSDSRDYSQPRASSRDNIRIVIANQPGERARKASTQSSSEDGIRVVRKTSVVELPERRSRSKVRAASRAYYLDDGTAQYVEDLTRPRYRSRPRSLSRSSYTEEYVPRQSRSRRRSSTSRVQFVDELDEPVLVSRPPKRITRRRAVYFDGAASSEPTENDDRGRQRSRSSHHESRISEGGVPLFKVESNPRSRQSRQTEENADLHPRSTLDEVTNTHTRRSKQSNDQERIDFVPVDSRMPFEREDYNTSFDPDQTPTQHFRSLNTGMMPQPASDPLLHKRSHSEITYTKSSPRQLNAEEGRVHNLKPSQPFYRTEAPPSKKRRYRDDSTEEDYFTATYRQVRPPSPAPRQSHSDYLSEMMQSAHITPPHQQHCRWQHSSGLGPPSPPRSASISDAENNTAYRPPVYPDVSQYPPAPRRPSPIRDLFGNIMDHTYDPIRGCNVYDDSKPPPKFDYDWMS